MEKEILAKAEPVLRPETLAPHLAAFPAGPREKLAVAFCEQSFAGKLGPDVMDGLGMNPRDLMLRLVPLAQFYALASFRVGAIAQGASGALYFGANLEIPRGPLSWTIHAEQSAVLAALVHGEKSISRLAVTAAPCGHCRQFLNELNRSSELEILLADREPSMLPQLLPYAFGPAELGLSVTLLGHAGWQVHSNAGTSSALLSAAIVEMCRSYAPYTQSPSAVALETRKGLVVAAPYVENAAYNPSIGPMLAALDRLRFHNAAASDICKAVLVQAEEAWIEQAASSHDMLKAAGAKAEVSILKVRVARN